MADYYIEGTKPFMHTSSKWFLSYLYKVTTSNKNSQDKPMQYIFLVLPLPTAATSPEIAGSLYQGLAPSVRSKETVKKPPPKIVNTNVISICVPLKNSSLTYPCASRNGSTILAWSLLDASPPSQSWSALCDPPQSAWPENWRTRDGVNSETHIEGGKELWQSYH